MPPSRQQRPAVTISAIVIVALFKGESATAAAAEAGVVDPRSIIVQLVDTAPARSSYLRHKQIHDTALDAVERRHPVLRRRPLFSSLHDHLDARLRNGGPSDPASVDVDIARRYASRSQRAQLRTTALDLLPLYVVDVTDPQANLDQLCAALKADPAIARAARDRAVTITAPPDDPLLTRQWTLHNTGQPFPIPGGEDTGTPGSDIDLINALEVFEPRRNVVVAVLDTGIDYNHPDIAERMWTDDAGRHGHDFLNDDDDPIDDHGHGTHCAGTSAASTDNGVGVAGVCPTARIMAVKFLNRFGNGVLSDGYDSIFYAVLNGADVISNSWGGASADEIGQAVMDYAYGHGAIVIAAAGNGNRELEYYPAAFDKVVSVAATDARDRRAEFSNYGAWIDIAAPGVNVLSLRAAGTDMSDSGGLNTVEEDYLVASGTSMSAPHVAGATAVLLAHYPDLSIDEVLERLLNTADDIAPLNDGYEDALGPGRLNLYRALTAPRSARQHLTAITLEEITGDGNGIPERGERVGLALELENIWATTTGVTVVVTTTDPFVDIITRTTVVGGLDVGQRAGLIVVCDLDADMPVPHDIAVDVALTPDEEAANHIAVPLSMGWPHLDAWPRRLTTRNDAILPIAADIDRDGTDDIIASHAGQLHVLSATGQPLNDGWPVATHDGRGFTAVGNLDDDADLEIILGGLTLVQAFDPDGAMLPGWPVNISGFDLLCADIDGDRRDEVVVTHLGTLHVLNGAGEELSDAWPLSHAGDLGQPVVTDIDLDGDSEVFVMLASGAGSTGPLLAYHHDGTPLEGWPIEFDGGFSNDSLLAGDLTGDGRPEIIVALDGTTLHVLNEKGHPLSGYWPTTLPDDEVWHIALADLTGDGALEILGAGKRSQKIFAVDHRAHILDGWPARIPGQFGFAQLPGTTIHASGDLDGDGQPEVVVGAATGLYLFGADGQLIDESPWLARHDATTPGTVWLAGIDDDKDVELLVGVDGQLVVHDFPAAADGVGWPGQRGSASRTASYASPSSATGRIAFDQLTYGAATPVHITIRDAGLDIDPGAVDHVDILLASTQEPESEHVIAYETGLNQGIFVVTVPLDTGTVGADGLLQVEHGDTIECRYFDGRSWHHHHAMIDAQAPTISDITMTPVFDGEFYHVDVAWTTNEPAVSHLYYGTSTPTAEVTQPSLVVTHAIRISDVQRGATYMLAIEALDPFGNLARADNDGAYYAVTIPTDGSTAITVTREGQPFDLAYIQLAVYDAAGQFIQKFASRALDASGSVHYGLSADEPLRLVVTVIVLGINFVAEYALPLQTMPGDVHLDLVPRTVTLLDGGAPLAGVQVTPRLECWPAGPGLGTDSSGAAELLVPADVDISLQIASDTVYWTNMFNTSAGLPPIDVADLEPNVLIDVRHDGQAQADERVHIIGLVEGQLALLDDTTTTGPDGRATCYLCVGGPVTVQARSFPDEVRSAPFVPPPIGAPPVDITLEIMRPRIIATTPPQRAIDARQPPDTGDATAWSALEIEFMPVPDDLSKATFDIVQFGGSTPPPRITAVEAIDDHRVSVTLSKPPAAAAWTTLRHAPSRSSVTVGALPGDVDGDGTSTIRDLLALIDTLNGHEQLPGYATDIDRNGAPQPADLIRMIDLLEGRGTDERWRNRALPWPYEIYWLDNDTTVRGTRPGSTDITTVVTHDDLMSTLTGIAVDNHDAALYWTQSDVFDRGKVVRADLDGGNPRTIAHADMPQALALDVRAGFVYWTQRNGFIRRVATTGGAIEDLVIQAPTLHATAIALDPDSGLMYWVSDQAIYRAGITIPEGSDPVSRDDIVRLIGDEAMAPVGLAIDPRRGWLVWTAATANAVLRARLDGSAIETIVSYGLDDPHGLAIDVRSGTIFFTDDGTNRIHRAHIDGSNADFVVPLGPDNPTRIAVP